MKIEIKSIYGELIFEGDFSCVAEAVKAALGAKKSLSFADLRSADLSDAKNAALVIAMTRILPPEGNLVGWKKLKCGEIAKLLIPTHAKRSHDFGRKCRASEALVLEIYQDGQPAEGEFVAHYDSAFTYSKGKTVKPTVPFDDDFTNECGSGIHFFITREEAEAYSL